MATAEYSKKISVPKFEPNDADVELQDCIDIGKYEALIRAINKELKDETINEFEAKFLKLCATRWIKFDYSNVAQYYATKASPKFQELLEDSNMVLIDINKTFENSVTTVREMVDGLSEEFIKRNIEKFDNYIL